MYVYALYWKGIFLGDIAVREMHSTLRWSFIFIGYLLSNFITMVLIDSMHFSSVLMDSAFGWGRCCKLLLFIKVIAP